jgi:ABC-type Fe3+-hydroxamate transport system substrate-binding protein
MTLVSTPFWQGTDQMGRSLTLNTRPQRIVSLVPSQTELLFDLGLREEVVGITKFCIHPAEFYKTTPKIGGTKQFKLEVIEQLQPDLILGNKEENYADGIYALAEKYPVWMSDILNWQDALAMIRTVGGLVGKTTQALAMAAEIEAQFASLSPLQPFRKAAYFIWRKPWMVAGGDTFINEMMQKIGLHNVFASLPARYPALSAEEMAAYSPEVVLLSSEPYPFQAKHIAELQALFPKAQFQLVDGEMFSWYGSRLLYAAKYLQNLQKYF